MNTDELWTRTVWVVGNQDVSSDNKLYMFGIKSEWTMVRSERHSLPVTETT